jgi:transcriptional regulator with XRE-family HTH domain
VIGAAVKKLRIGKGLSLRDLASASGLSRSFICDIEHDRKNPSIDVLGILARELGVSAAILLGEAPTDSTRGECVR